MWMKRTLDRYLLQHLDANLACRAFTQRDNGGLVAAFDLRRVPLCELACAISCGKCQFETIPDHVETVYDGNAGHVGFLLSMSLILPYVLGPSPRSRVREVDATLHKKDRLAC